jgi:hypothetical protein
VQKTAIRRRNGGMAMGVRNYLIEGVSGTGKTAVCKELQRRGYHAINGDIDLAYQGDPDAGRPMEGSRTSTTSGKSVGRQPRMRR